MASFRVGIKFSRVGITSQRERLQHLAREKVKVKFPKSQKGHVRSNVRDVVFCGCTLNASNPYFALNDTIRGSIGLYCFRNGFNTRLSAYFHFRIIQEVGIVIVNQFDSKFLVGARIASQPLTGRNSYTLIQLLFMEVAFRQFFSLLFS